MQTCTLQDEATLLAIKYQEDAGVDIISDGEQRRDNFYSFICHRRRYPPDDHGRPPGICRGQSGFRDAAQCIGRAGLCHQEPDGGRQAGAKEPLVLEDFKFLREHTRKPVKVTLPGPYLLSRSTWVKNLSDTAYPTREALADDIVQILRDELQALAAAGADIVQFDEPVLTELVFAGKSATRTFMCAALAASASPEGELEFAVDLINRVVAGIDGPILALHVCRAIGVRRRRFCSRVMRSPHPYFAHAGPAARPGVCHATGRHFGGLASPASRVQLGFGAVNPRTSLGVPEAVASRVTQLAELIAPERIYLNPDCGFGTFADRPVGTLMWRSRSWVFIPGGSALARGT